MIEWMKQNGDVLQVIASFSTLLVWIFYAELLKNNYVRTRRPKIIINQALGKSMHSRCLISNMSMENFHVEAVITWLYTDRGARSCVVTDSEADREGNLPKTVHDGTLQGPLPSGGCLDAGDLSTMVRRAQRMPFDRQAQSTGENDTGDNDTFYHLEVLVLGVYSSEPGIVGASRLFEFNRDGGISVRDPETKQHRGFFQRRRMYRLHKRFI